MVTGMYLVQERSISLFVLIVRFLEIIFLDRVLQPGLR